MIFSPSLFFFWGRSFDFSSQIALGVAAYGHSFHVATGAALDGSGSLVLSPPFDKNQQPLGDSDVPGAPPSKKSSFSTIT